MDHEIGIPADGRRKVYVAVGRQPEVTEVGRVIPRLLHGAQHQERNRPCHRRPGHPAHQRLKMCGSDSGRRRIQREAETGNEGLELLHLPGIRRFVNPIQRRHAGLFQMLRHRLVGQQHELLDHLVRHIPLGCDDVDDQAVGIEDDFGFGQIKVDRATAVTTGRQHAVQLVHQFEQRHERCVLGAHLGIAHSDNGVDCRVGHARITADDAVVHLVAHHSTIGGHLHEARLDQTVDLGLQRAHACRQRFRKHVHGPVGKVDGCASVIAAAVECRALGHIVRDIRDVHPQPVVTVRQPLQ